MTVLESAGSIGARRAFRRVPRTGVIYVTNEASARGYGEPGTDWSNLGQGQPEAGGPARRPAPCRGAADRSGATTSTRPSPASAICARRWRRCTTASTAGACRSQYSADNVSISSGGRAALTRAVASLGRVNLGHFLPDYTAYEELLDIFRLVSPIPILLRRDQGYGFSSQDFEHEVLGRGLSAVLLSNPCNPMGKLVSGEALAEWIAVAGRLDCSLLLDEFYSHYIWNPGPGEPGPLVSAARYVEDVDNDPVVIFDGLTKNWRYPGWRGDLDAGSQEGHRGGGERGLVSRRRWLEASAARRGVAPRTRVDVG